MGDINLGRKLKNLDEEVNTKVDKVSSVIADNGDWLKSKNLLNSTLKTTISNGITCTNNGDGTYTLNGTATTNTYFDLVKGGTFNSTEYVGKKLYGIEGTVKTGLSIRISGPDRLSKQEYNSESIDIEDNGNNLYLALRIASGTNATNWIVKPMISNEVTDYTPYVKSNVELASDLASLIETLKSKGVID